MLRRAEPEQVCIWLASSKPVSIRTEIFRVDDLKKTRDTHESKTKVKAIGLGYAESLRLGERLYVGLVIARPIQVEEDVVDNDSHTSKVGFPTDDLLAYDIELSYDDNYVKKSETLKDLGLLSGNNAIIYENQQSDDNNNDIL